MLGGAGILCEKSVSTNSCSAAPCKAPSLAEAWLFADVQEFFEGIAFSISWIAPWAAEECPWLCLLPMLDGELVSKLEHVLESVSNRVALMVK
jgi:hypothetical protein